MGPLMAGYFHLVIPRSLRLFFYMNAATTNKNESTILQHLAKRGQHNVANQLNLDESTVSRMKDKMDQFAGLLSICGLKVVPEELICYEQRYVDALRYMAKKHLAENRMPPLDWE